jgi:two-component sensor histidine kinase
MEFPATLRGPRQARHFVVDTLAGWGQPETAGDAAVVVTELATNAVVHARSAFDVTVRLSEDMIRISVRDASGEIPVIRSAGHLASSGRGVQLVSKLSTRWGTEPAPTGKAVWAELALA